MRAIDDDGGYSPGSRVGRIDGATVAALYDIISDAPDGITAGVEVTLRRYATGIDQVKVEVRIDTAPYMLTGIVTRHNAGGGGRGRLCRGGSTRALPGGTVAYRLWYDDGETRRSCTVTTAEAARLRLDDYRIPADVAGLVFGWVARVRATFDAPGISKPEPIRWSHERLLKNRARFARRTCAECGVTSQPDIQGWPDVDDQGWAHCDYCGSQFDTPAA